MSVLLQHSTQIMHSAFIVKNNNIKTENHFFHFLNYTKLNRLQKARLTYAIELRVHSRVGEARRHGECDELPCCCEGGQKPLVSP